MCQTPTDPWIPILPCLSTIFNHYNPFQIWKNNELWWFPVMVTSDVTSKASLKSSVILLSDVVYPSEELWSLVSSALPRFDTGNLVVAFTSCAKLEEGEPVSDVNQWGRFFNEMGWWGIAKTSQHDHGNDIHILHIYVHNLSWCIYVHIFALQNDHTLCIYWCLLKIS